MQIRDSLPGRLVRIRHPRDMTVRDFQQGHTVLLGGPWINPWGQMFEDRFTLRMIPAGRAGSSAVQNLRPAQGERAQCAPRREGVKEMHYARVALARNLQGTGRVLLLGATSGSALEAAARYLTSPAAPAELASRLQGSMAAWDLVEILLEIESHQGVPSCTKLLIARHSGTGPESPPPPGP